MAPTPGRAHALSRDGRAPVTDPAIAARVAEILTTRLGVDPEAIGPDARLREDLGLDSLDAVELAIAAERAFGVDIEEEQVARLRTVADIVALVAALRREGGRP